MSNFYLEFPEKVVADYNMPGPIQTVHFDYISTYHRIIHATRIWFEDAQGEVYLIDPRTDTQTKLNPEELKEFFWIKLSAINV